MNAYVVGSSRNVLSGPRVPATYAVVPGEQKLLVTYARNDTFSKIDANPKAITFTAEAGHVYKFESLVPVRIGFSTLADSEWDVRVIDAAGGTVVAETHGRAAVVRAGE